MQRKAMQSPPALDLFRTHWNSWIVKLVYEPALCVHCEEKRTLLVDSILLRDFVYSPSKVSFHHFARVADGTGAEA